MEVKNCCFCIDLRKGSLIIGYLDLATSLFAIIFQFLSTYFNISYPTTAENFVVMAVIVIKEQYLPIAFFVLGVFLIIDLIISIILLIGLHKHKRGYVKAYLTYTIILIIVRVIPLVASIVFKMPVEEIFSNLVSLVLYIYFLIVIRSYWLKMDDASSTPAVDKIA